MDFERTETVERTESDQRRIPMDFESAETVERC